MTFTPFAWNAFSLFLLEESFPGGFLILSSTLCQHLARSTEIYRVPTVCWGAACIHLVPWGLFCPVKFLEDSPTHLCVLTDNT